MIHQKKTLKLIERMQLNQKKAHPQNTKVLNQKQQLAGTEIQKCRTHKLPQTDKKYRGTRTHIPKEYTQ